MASINAGSYCKTEMVKINYIANNTQQGSAVINPICQDKQCPTTYSIDNAIGTFLTLSEVRLSDYHDDHRQIPKVSQHFIQM